MNDPIDDYLLGGATTKAQAIDAALAAPREDPRAQPFYRALAAVGTRTADEALIALRAVLAGLDADDAVVVRLRDLTRAARAGDADARERYLREVGG